MSVWVINNGLKICWGTIRANPNYTFTYPLTYSSKPVTAFSAITETWFIVSAQNITNVSGWIAGSKSGTVMIHTIGY